MENLLDSRRQQAIDTGIPAVARAAHYDSLADQIGRLTKALAHLAAAGIDIGPDGTLQVERVQAVKSRFPKPIA
jgi:hypothetical protein